jgi:hypothetical protein
MVYKVIDSHGNMNECNEIKLSNMYVFSKMARIMNPITIIQLCEQKLRIKMNMKAMNMKLENINK